MAVTISLYNHTRSRFASGANAVADTYKLMLCTASTFNAADTTLAAVVKTEVAGGTGYPPGGAALTNVSAPVAGTANSAFTADQVSIPAAGGPIASSSGVLYNDTDAGDPPVAHIDFGTTVTAPDGVPFVVQWDPAGIITFT